MPDSDSRGIRFVAIATLAVVGAAPCAVAQIGISATTTAFTDISATGTPLAASDNIEASITGLALGLAGFNGNELLVLPATSSSIRVGNNGAVVWNVTGAQEVGRINRNDFASMPAANGPDDGNGGLFAGAHFLCPYWDDHVPLTPGDTMTLNWQVIAGNLILQWSRQAHATAPTVGSVQFQAIIYGGATYVSGAPLVDFVYNDTFLGPAQFQNDGGSATIGYKHWEPVDYFNDVEFGTGGGNNTIADAPFGDATMKPKVGGYLGNNDPTLPHALRIRGVFVDAMFCPGDGTGTPCPCANNSTPGQGRGCTHSLGFSGVLRYSGAASIAADTLVLRGGGMPNSSALYFQGTSQQGGGMGVAFGDGLRCVGGSVIRLGTKTNAINSSSYPASGDLPISVKGMNVAGNVRTYQVWYRNAAAFCDPATFNLSNGLHLTWTP